MKTITSKLKKYFKNTSVKQIKKDWETTKEWDKVKPIINEFIPCQEKRNI